MNLLMELHERPKRSYICLLDIAKAFPSTPHVCLVEALQALRAPPHVSGMVKPIYTLSTCQYSKLRFPLSRGIKEGCSLSPSSFVLVYETFHATLAKGFPDASSFVYVDDIAVVTKNANEMQRVLKRVQDLSLILEMNPGKTKVYKWAATPRTRQKRHMPLHDVLRWNGKDILMQPPPPMFRYLGHTIVHPSWAQRARDEVLDEAESDLTRYGILPLNGFERVQLLNFVLIPRWPYHTMLIPHDGMFQHKICSEFVAIAKGLEHNKENIYKAHNPTHINSPVKYGGLGLRQIYWAYRIRYATLVQGLLRKPTGRLSRLVAQPIEHMMTPLRDYVTILSQLGGNTTLVLAPHTRPPTSANFIDEETSGDEEWITQQAVAEGIPKIARRYITRCSANEYPTHGEVPPRFTRVEVARI